MIIANKLFAMLLLFNVFNIVNAEEGVPTCNVGVYINELFDFDTRIKTFSGDLWLWSICPDEAMNAVRNIDFINAVSIQDSEIYSENRKQGIYSFRRFKGVFHQIWELDNFPFDKHSLLINIEDSVFDKSKLRYLADKKNSGISDDLYLRGWRITDFSIEEMSHHYLTNYGDPDLKSGSDYSRISIIIDISRSNTLVFFRMTAGVYAAILIAFMTFFMNSKYESLYSGQLGLIVGSLFAILVNYQSTAYAIGYIPNLSLIDIIHIVALIYIILIGTNVLYDRYQITRNPSKEYKVPNFTKFSVFLLSFLIINSILIGRSYYFML